MDKTEGPIQSVARAISIMETLLRKPEMGVSELSAELGLGKSTIYRLLLTMKVRGLIDQTLSGKYKLGIRLAIFGETVVRRSDLRKEAEPFLLELAKYSGENVSLSILDEFHILYIDRIDAMEPLRLGVKVGLRLPAFCTSMGKAILANLPPARLEEILADARFQQMMIVYTENTITDPAALRLELQRVRAQGYAEDNGEHHQGVRCIGAPLFDHQGDVAAAISVTGPFIRITDCKAASLQSRVKDTALRVSRQLGYQGNIPPAD